MTGTIYNGTYTTGIGITNLATQDVAAFPAAGKVTSGTTITGTHTTGIELDPPFYTNPVVIAPGAAISNIGYNYAVYRDSGATTVFTIQNYGTVTGGAAAKGVGIYLAPGGSVTNTTSGVITGYTGVKITGGLGTVIQSGTIVGSGALSGIGVNLRAGGSVTNTAGASIAGYTGIEISGAAGTVVNRGSISENGGRFGTGVDLLSGGSVVNAASASIVDSIGTIAGSVGVKISGAAGNVANSGSISGWGVGVGLYFGGMVINSTSALISAYTHGVNINAGGGTLLNYGTIRTTLALGVPSAVTVGSSGAGANEAGGTIAGIEAGVEISGGSFTNNAGGTITGGSYGVVFGSGTLTNAGTIIGNNGTAVGFSFPYQPSGPGDLVLEPGFAFTGTVVANGAVSDTLELGSASSAGTVSGLGTEFIHFSSLVFDPGAKWTASGLVRGFDEIPGIFTITGFAAGDTIDIIGGGTIPATITGPGRLQLDSGAFADTIAQITGSGTVAGVGSVVIDAGASLQLAGGGALPANISGAGTLDLLGAVPYTFAGNALGTATVAAMGSTLDITSTGFANPRTLVAEDGGTIDFTGLTNLSGTRLAGGTYTLDAGSTMQLPDNARVATLAANLTLSGAGSVVESLDTADSKEVAIESTLTTIAAGGALGVLAGRSYATANAISDAGSLTIGGAFSAASLDVATGGRLDVTSSGVLSAPLSVAGTATDAGTIAAAVKLASGGGQLVLVPGFKLGGPAIGGGAGSVLELAAGTSPGLLNALGAGFTNFGAVTVDAGAAWTVGARAAALGVVTITGDSASNLTLTTGGTFSLAGVSGFGAIKLAAGTNNFTLTDATFARGTVRINAAAGGNETMSAAATTAASTGKTLIFTAGLGTDALTGGVENDSFYFSTADLTNADTVMGGGDGDNLFITSGGTVNAGGVSGVANYWLAAAGADSLLLHDGNFSGLSGSPPTLVVHDGALGNTVSAAADTAASTAKKLVYVASAGNDAFKGGFESDTVRVGTAALVDDTLTGGSGANSLVLANAGTVTATGVRGFEYYDLANGGPNSLALTDGNFAGIAGSPPTITIQGGNAGNTIDAVALTAADRILAIGGAGTDVITGGAGNDLFYFTEANLAATDIVKGGGGSDTLVVTTAGIVHAAGVSGVETYRLANSGANTLTLTAGNFTGVPPVSPTPASPATITVFDGNAGNTVSAAGVATNNRIVVHAGAGADKLTGGAGNDTLYAVRDTTMTGGPGANVFGLTNSGPDTNTITDFGNPAAANDIWFSDAAFGLTGSGLLPPGLFTANPSGAFTAATQRFTYDTSDGSLYYSASSTTAGEHLIVTLAGHPALTAAHLIHS